MGIFNFRLNGNESGAARLDDQQQKAVLAANSAAEQDAKRKVAIFDSVTSCVMVADENYNIVSLNKSAQAMLRNVEAEIRQALPHFAVDKLIGSNIDIFHKNPSHQRQMMDTLMQPHKASIKVASVAFELIASPILDEHGKRLGIVVEWKDVTEALERQRLEEERQQDERRVALQNFRIKSALDSVTSNVMLADENGTIIYANESVLNMLRDAQQDIRKDLPHFDVDTVLGSSFDVFHKNPAHQREMIKRLTGTYRTRITVGGRKFSLIASPVRNEKGEALGTVVEWQDLLNEQIFESVVDKTIRAAVEGDLSTRIDLAGREGLIKTVSSSINDLLEVFETLLQDVNASLSALSAGDLKRKVELEYGGSYGLLKESINTTIDTLVKVVAHIKESAGSVKEAAFEIAAGNSNLSQRTEQQAASLEETSSSMMQVMTNVDQNSRNAFQAKALSDEASNFALAGSDVVKQAIASMDAISSSSNKIGDIIGVINEIAFQTNMLALNAAVEAARAGQQGRGFAVVAEEVRSLAGRSAVAAKEIKTLIQDSLDKVGEGSVLVNKSGAALGDIIQAVQKVNTIVNEISVSSSEQSMSLAEISKAVGLLDEMTQQNAALVEEAAAASESLESQAGNLKELIGFFKVGDKG